MSLLKQAESPRLLDDPDNSEDELPEVTELLREDAKRRHAEELKKMKLRALEQQTVRALQDSEDDDLVISTDPRTTIKEEEDNRRLKQSKQSMARKTVARLAHVNPAAQAKKASLISPGRIRKEFPSVIQETIASGSCANLQRILFTQAQEHASREIRRKEEEWTRHGGHLAQKPVVPSGNFECAVRAIAGKGLEIVEARKINRMEAESDNDEDGEWRLEMQGSASLATNEEENEVLDTQEIDEDITMVAEEQNADDSDADDTKVHISKRNLVLSDSEDEGNDKHDSIFRQSPISSGLATEDEHDKENNTGLMYDQGEDKENKRVVRHPPISKRYNVFDITDVALSSPESSPRNLDGVNLTRRPFQELVSEESPKAKLFPTSSSAQTFVNRLQQASPLASALAPAPTFKPFLSDCHSFAGFSQFSQAEPEGLGAVPLQPGFSELFEPGTEKRKLPLNLVMDRFDEVEESLFLWSFEGF